MRSIAQRLRAATPMCRMVAQFTLLMLAVGVAKADTLRTITEFESVDIFYGTAVLTRTNGTVVNFTQAATSTPFFGPCGPCGSATVVEASTVYNAIIRPELRDAIAADSTLAGELGSMAFSFLSQGLVLPDSLFPVQGVSQEQKRTAAEAELMAQLFAQPFPFNVLSDTGRVLVATRTYILGPVDMAPPPLQLSTYYASVQVNIFERSLGLQVTAVPEPATYGLVLAGLLSLLIFGRRASVKVTA